MKHVQLHRTLFNLVNQIYLIFRQNYELLEKENKSLHERILLLEKRGRDKDRRLNDIAQQIAELDNSYHQMAVL